MPPAKRDVAPASLYSVHPSVAMVQKSIAALKEKTGRTLEEWAAFIQQAGPPSERQRREWLKHEHGLGTNYSWWLAERAEGKGREDDDPEAYLQAAVGYVEAMYAGSKGAVRPIHDELIGLVRNLGEDVKVCPCQTIVPLYRNHVFAEIKPSTRTRIDFGLALKAAVDQKRKLPARLLETGGLKKGNRITHRIGVSSPDQIDDELKRWTKVAYDLDG